MLFAVPGLGEILVASPGRYVCHTAEQQDEGTPGRVRVELRNSGTAP